MEFAASWTEDERALWERIAGHRFEADTPITFVGRLARDKAWTVGFARRAVEEYRRFAFLCIGAPAPMTPSEEVDEVWHLHLLHTRDYWDVWCGEVLGARLHHDPTPGGPGALAVYRQQYAATLIRYERFFGPSPPDLWPASHRRFAPHARFRGVDAERALVVPLHWPLHWPLRWPLPSPPSWRRRT